MKLGDLVVTVPGAFSGLFSKMIRTDLMEETKKSIEENHLYHFTKKENIDKILESGYLKPAKPVVSYGKPCSFMFNGLPDLDAMMTNMSLSPFLNASEIYYAVELDVKRDELNNYKMRPC